MSERQFREKSFKHFYVCKTKNNSTAAARTKKRPRAPLGTYESADLTVKSRKYTSNNQVNILNRLLALSLTATSNGCIFLTSRVREFDDIESSTFARCEMRERISSKLLFFFSTERTIQNTRNETIVRPSSCVYGRHAQEITSTNEENRR